LTFLEQKRRALERLRIRGADDEVEGIIEKLNGFESFFTTSSCSGRIALISVPEIGAKREADFFGKWHRPVKLTEVLEAMNSAEKGEIWLISQSPILHVSCRRLESAKVLLQIAMESGFKLQWHKDNFEG